MALHDKANALLKAAVEAGDVPGVVAAVTDAEGTIYEGGFGERIQGGGVEMSPDTVGWIASMTKALTGTAVMQLVEQGRLSLEAPGSEVLPYLGEVGVLDGFGDDGQPRTRPAASPITLRQLMTHTSGFSYEIWSADIARYLEATGTPGITTCENAALTTPLRFDPGTDWDYGIGIDWAGKMIEQVSGLKLGDYLMRNVFDPLGMT